MDPGDVDEVLELCGIDGGLWRVYDAIAEVVCVVNAMQRCLHEYRSWTEEYDDLVFFPVEVKKGDQDMSLVEETTDGVRDRLPPKADMTFVVTIIGILTLACMFLGPDHFQGLEDEKKLPLTVSAKAWIAFLGARALNRLYFVMTTLSTVGYGDIYPRSVIAKVISISMMSFMVAVAVN